MSSMGHIVDLRVDELTLEVGDDDTITAEFDATSLRVVSDGPSASDRKKIEDNAAKTLGVNKYQKFRFRSTSVQRDGNTARIQGDLTLHGVTNSISVEASNDGSCWSAKITLDQRKYNIKPYSAPFGAIKVKPEVEVSISVPSE